MILSGILNVFYAVFSTFLNLIPISLPSIPSEIMTVWNDFLSIISSGLGLLGNWFDTGFIVVCLGVSLALFTFEHSWEFIRWLLRFLHVIP